MRKFIVSIALAIGIVGTTTAAAPAPKETDAAVFYTPPVVEETHEPEQEPVDESYPRGIYLGRFKITHYCPCTVCNDGWGTATAWAGTISPGRTIAVDPKVISKLSQVYIDGYGVRKAEDCGGAIKGYHIDLAVSTHQEALEKGVVYKDVYLSE